MAFTKLRSVGTTLQEQQLLSKLPAKGAVG